jgi:hypothetical protein
VLVPEDGSSGVDALAFEDLRRDRSRRHALPLSR